MAPQEDDEHTTAVRPADLLATAKNQRRPGLVVLSGPSTVVGQLFPLSGSMTLGRSDSDIVIEDSGVSRRHARFDVSVNGEVTVVDLGSRNGIFCDGARIESRALQDGDKLHLGSSTVLKLAYQDPIEEAYQRNLYESTTRDALTQAFNKKYFVDALEKEIAFAYRHEMPLTLLMVDIDHFKRVNDEHGHPAGDYVLAQVSRKIADTLRTEDILCRYGGEEFAVLLRNTSLSDGLACAERIRKAVERAELSYGGADIPCTISIGAAALPEGPEMPGDELVGSADRALYLAKSNGRNRCEA